MEHFYTKPKKRPNFFIRHMRVCEDIIHHTTQWYSPNTWESELDQRKLNWYQDIQIILHDWVVVVGMWYLERLTIHKWKWSVASEIDAMMGITEKRLSGLLRINTQRGRQPMNYEEGKVNHYIYIHACNTTHTLHSRKWCDDKMAGPDFCKCICMEETISHQVSMMAYIYIYIK